MPATRPLAAVLVLLAVLVLAVPSAAHADALEVASPGARNLAAGGGWLAWAEPAGDGRWRLVVRAPGGRVTRPPVPTFTAPPDPTIGSDRAAFAGRRLLALYSRCRRASTRAGCDVHALDLRTGEEERVERLATRTSSETSADQLFGTVVAVRRGGPAPGVYVGRLRPAQPLRRITRIVPELVRTNGGRIATLHRTPRGWDLALRRRSGRPPVLPVRTASRRRPRGVVLDAYRLTFLLGHRAFQTARIPGRSRRRVAVLPADRPLPEGTTGVEPRGPVLRRALTPQGLVRLRPAPRFR